MMGWTLNFVFFIFISYNFLLDFFTIPKISIHSFHLILYTELDYWNVRKVLEVTSSERCRLMCCAMVSLRTFRLMFVINYSSCKSMYITVILQLFRNIFKRLFIAQQSYTTIWSLRLISPNMINIDPLTFCLKKAKY